MADEIMGTLFESDATSLLDSEASHLLTELESMTADPGQPPPRQPPQQTPYYDYGGGNTGIPPQAMQSPASQQMQSPAGSMHSPGGIISPSTPQHFGSPPPQQSNQLQRQVSGVRITASSAAVVVGRCAADSNIFVRCCSRLDYNSSHFNIRLSN